MMQTEHYCPLCGTEVDEFAPGGHNKRPGVRCPKCKSNTRARFAWLIFERMTDLFDGGAKRMLHVAPEHALAQRLSKVPDIDYLTADIDPAKAMVQMDITNIGFPDSYFDAIMCSHVLEHVPDDRKGMRELARVLKPTGWALFMIPLKRESTFEDFSVADPAERERLFGHPEHVRIYGDDFSGRLSESGFNVRRVLPEDVVSDAESVRIGLPAKTGNAVFMCSRTD